MAPNTKTVNVTQEATLRLRAINTPKPIHREITYTDGLSSIQNMVEQGWAVIECRLERRVECKAVEERVPRKPPGRPRNDESETHIEG